MPTRIASIAVANLRSPSQWIDHFVVECYTDAALSQRVSVQTSTANWDGSNSYQHTLILFTGLNLGQNYWFRSGVVVPVTGETAWSSSWLEVAGEPINTPGGLTLTQASGSPHYLASGVLLRLLASNLPPNFDRVDVVWTYDGSVPVAGTQPYMRIGLQSGNILTFTVGIQPGLGSSVYVRSVNTRQVPAAWQFVGLFGAGSLDNVADGFTYGRTNLSGMDSLGHIDPRKTGFIKLGSINPAWTGQLNWAATTFPDGSASVTWTWPQLIIKLVDGTDIFVNANPSGYTVAGLLGAATYYFYPWSDAFLNPSNIGFVSGGVGTDGVAFTAKNTDNDRSQSLQNHIPLSAGAITVTTPSSGGSGGGGGGSGGGGGGGCPRYGQLVVEKVKGMIPVELLEVSDHVEGENGQWLRVKGIIHKSETEFLRITTHRGEVIEHSPHTKMKLDDGTEKATCDLTMTDLIVTRKGAGRIAHMDLITESGIKDGEPPMRKVVMEIESPHFFWCGSTAPDILAHNIMLGK